VGYYDINNNNKLVHCKVIYGPKNKKKLKLFQDHQIELVHNIMNNNKKINNS
jgi:hypothetical protein